jgi:hypothetical protein
LTVFTLTRITIAVLSLVAPVYGQYAGPAILSRGEVPAAMSEATIQFRFFGAVMGTYDTGLATIAVNDQGGLATDSSAGVNLAGGIGGSHSWAHTKLGLDYRGSISYYTQKTLYNSANQALLLGISHQFSRHTAMVLRESAGYFSRDFGLAELNQAVPFDPAISALPTSDFFDNRTAYMTTQADFTMQRSTRLSLDMGGDFLINRRQSKALSGVTGEAARGDIEYRLNRRSTIGAGYHYQKFTFTRTIGGTDAHIFIMNYGIRISRNVEFSGFGGAMRVESKFIQNVPVDPVIAELLGITFSPQLVHSIRWSPNYAGRLSRTLHRGLVFVMTQRTVNPGNGLFLTSYMTSATAGYTYTGLRRWSATWQAGYSRSESLGNISGIYTGFTATASVSRMLRHGLSLVGSYSARQYGSPEFSAYNRLIYQTGFGMAFSPGETPLRIW